MIVLVGMPDEPPVSRLAEEAAKLGVAVEMLTETEAASWNLTVDAGPHALRAAVGAAGRTIDLDDATGLYLRITAPRVAGPVPDPSAARALTQHWPCSAPGPTLPRCGLPTDQRPWRATTPSRIRQASSAEPASAYPTRWLPTIRSRYARSNGITHG